jgi:hypothetical protein
MKNLVMSLALILSVNLSAKILATDGFNKILPTGTYTGAGENGDCTVNVNVSSDSATVSIQSLNKHDSFAVINLINNYTVDEVKGEIAASASLRFPRYLNGGTKNLFVRTTENNEVEVFIISILLDHRGNDMNTFASCKVSK